LRFSVPHPIPYQGSKRRLAAAILSHVPAGRYTRLVEPFAGSAAVTLAAASRTAFPSYMIGDALDPLLQLWEMVIDSPKTAAAQYAALWHRERLKPIHEYYDIRAEFNFDRNPPKLLYLLARCVKNAVRFNTSGEFNQSPDKRRTGTHPELMEAELLGAHQSLAGRCQVMHGDFLSLILAAQDGDIFYLDPPYQGTSQGRDRRYISGVSRDQIIRALTILNEKRIPFILSYDGLCGEHSYGEPLPESLARRTLLDVGRSSQATLNGRDDVTIESLYLSRDIPTTGTSSTLSLKDFSGGGFRNAKTPTKTAIAAIHGL
jgi:DNA adenine methylase